MKVLKKIAIGLLVVLLAVPVFIAVPKNTTVVQAATVRLSKTKLTVYVGKTKTLKVKNTSKKVKWSSSNKKIVKVTSKGKVTGLQAGTAYVYAKVGKQRLTCRVTVKFSQKDAKKNIKITFDQAEYDPYTIACVTNNNSYPIQVDGTMIFYNQSGNALDTSSDYSYCIGAGQTSVMSFIHPFDEDFNIITPSSYKFSYNVQPSYYTSYSKKIKSSYEIGTSGIVGTFQNKSGKELDTIHATCLMYDPAGNLIGVESNYLNCKASGSTDYTTFSFPYDDNFDYVIPAYAKLYVDHAYQF